MLKLEEDIKVYLSLSSVDMRRGSMSLSAEVESYFKSNSLDGAVYVFISRDRKKVKLLQWDGDGYWLCYKRLETSTFRVQKDDQGSEVLTALDLNKLLSGVDLKRILLPKKVSQSLSKS